MLLSPAVPQPGVLLGPAPRWAPVTLRATWGDPGSGRLWPGLHLLGFLGFISSRSDPWQHPVHPVLQRGTGGVRAVKLCARGCAGGVGQWCPAVPEAVVWGREQCPQAPRAAVVEVLCRGCSGAL